MVYELPALPYEFNALEPHIDVETMKIHHGKHHAGYVIKLNKALEGHGGQGNQNINELISDLDNVPSDIREKVRNNAGGHANHSLFWKIMCPASESGEPEGKLADAINEFFGSFDEFKKEFSEKAASHFGSGWAWLVKSNDEEKKISIVTTPNQDNPLMENIGIPILGLDLWEHAYYLKYQNKRPDYIEAWFNVVNWKKVGEMFEAD